MTIESHISKNKNILDDPTISPQLRRHTQSELEQLEIYKERHPDSDYDPTSLELYCDQHPDAAECRVYDD